MKEPIEELYFNWLCAKVIPVELPPSTTIYRDLLRILYKTEFVWSIPGDRNREADGVELRLDFLNEVRVRDNHEWHFAPCSVLEVFIAFAKRALFQTEIPVKEWFWIFMDNLELGEYRHLSKDNLIDIEHRLQTFLYRQYSENGQGGMFPMRWPREDQRKVEIWYQFCQYLEDQGMI